jgi:hypothetical protein
MALTLHARLYEHNRSHDVLLSRTADVTSALVESERLCVIVIHAHPSKPSDITQLCKRLGDGADTRIIALIDSEVDAGAAALYAAGADTVLETGTAVGELTDQILSASRSETVLRGRLEQLGGSELIQMLCLCRRSLELRIESSAGHAMVWLQNGEIYHAVCEGLSGQRAMSAIARADNGRFRAVVGGHLPARTIHEHWQHVLLEAAQRDDEERESTVHPAAGAGDVDGSPPNRSQVRKLGKTYRELTELGLQSIKAGDFSKAREYWDAARTIGPEAGAPEAAGVAKTSGVVAKTSGALPPPRRAERR